LEFRRVLFRSLWPAAATPADAVLPVALAARPCRSASGPATAGLSPAARAPATAQRTPRDQRRSAATAAHARLGYATGRRRRRGDRRHRAGPEPAMAAEAARVGVRDRKSTRLNSSHVKISYAVFCLKKKRKQTT